MNDIMCGMDVAVPISCASSPCASGVGHASKVRVLCQKSWQQPLNKVRRQSCTFTVCHAQSTETYTATEKTTLKRYAKRAEYDRKVVHAILDEAFVCHIGFVADGQPYVIPTGFARDGEQLYFHGSVGSRMLRALESGSDICVTVTLLDGLVLARSQFNTDMNYRCVVVLGKARPITDPKEKAAALLKLTEHIIPGRTQHAREASDRELSQTSVLAINLNEVSAKVRMGNTNDDDEDYSIPVWAGVVPLKLTPGVPIPDPRLDTALESEIPEYVLPYQRPVEMAP